MTRSAQFARGLWWVDIPQPTGFKTLHQATKALAAYLDSTAAPASEPTTSTWGAVSESATSMPETPEKFLTRKGCHEHPE